MAKYAAKHKGEPITSAFLGGKEYKADDGLIEVPDDHVAAHQEAASIGLKPAYVEDAAGKKAAK